MDAPSPTEKPRKVRRVEPTLEAEHRVVYSDIDFNSHVNTMRYIAMMFDLLPIERAAQERAVRLDIHFLHEWSFRSDAPHRVRAARRAGFVRDRLRGDGCCARFADLAIGHRAGFAPAVSRSGMPKGRLIGRYGAGCRMERVLQRMGKTYDLWKINSRTSISGASTC